MTLAYTTFSSTADLCNQHTTLNHLLDIFENSFITKMLCIYFVFFADAEDQKCSYNHQRSNAADHNLMNEGETWHENKKLNQSDLSSLNLQTAVVPEHL